MSLDTLSLQFITSYEESDAINLMLHLINNKLYDTGVYIGDFLHKLLPFSTTLIEQYALCSYETKRYSLAYYLYNKILENRVLNQTYSNLILVKSYQCIEHIKNRYTGYIKPKITPNKNAYITFTITTCKRVSLFKQTMNSFLSCCLDKHLIKEWICVDDNSDECDRREMEVLYPFFKFVFKKPEDKGHSRSMNIILSMVKTPYLFHMEDDWKFILKKNYMSECLEILSTKNVHQCAINKNYAEVENIDIKGGLFKTTTNGLRYYIHEHCPNEKSYSLFNSKYGNCKNSAYWPNYTLRPSLISVKTLETVGKFNENAPHFEMEYAYRYTMLGYKTGFMEGIYCLHIGRLTSERGNKNIENAYTLNGINQFVIKEKPPRDDIIVINLDRRPDRMDKFKGLNFTRFSAIDGTKLVSNFQIQRIFEGNDYNMYRGMVGCALSHLCVWIDFLYNKPNLNYITILEDDIIFKPSVFKNIKSITEYYSDWDIIFLGHSKRNKKQFQQPTLHLEKWSTHTSLRKSIGGSFSYIISKKGALSMLEFINKRGMTNCIDTMIQLACDHLNVYYTSPCQIMSEFTDTDIQRDLVSLTDTNILDSVIKIVEKYEPEWQSNNKISINKEISSSNQIKIKIDNNSYIYIDKQYKDIIKELYPERLKLGTKFHIDINYNLKE